jgi:GGDEF domain-containing protein
MKITPTSLTVNQLFGSTNEQYVIPTYQRRYSWHERQVVELIEDISLLEDNDTHLLGSIVCLAGPHKAGLNQLELVDGQQRLTTVTILMECIRQRLDREGMSDEVAEIGQLLTAKPHNGKATTKVALDSIDAGEFSDLIHQTGHEFKNHQLVRAFEIIRERAKEASIEDIRTFLYRLRNQAFVIRLDVSEAKDAFKLFETINNRGLRLSPTDIIKNFLLGNAARFSSDALDLARKSWAELLSHLDDTNSDAFFRYYLMALVQTRIKTSEVVARFKNVFMTQVAEAADLPDRRNYPDLEENDEDDSGETGEAEPSEPETKASAKISFKKFLTRLVMSAKFYSEVVSASTSDVRINRHLQNLRRIKAAQTYGFLMHLRVGGCGDRDFREILKLTENFVLRRHVCRERANETEALFARLCGNDPKDPIKSTKDAYRDLCPTDDKFKDEFASAHFSANLIERARYCLERIETAKHGGHDELQVLGADDVHVEHIMPQRIRTKKSKDDFGDWATYLGVNSESLHPKFVDRIGNLTIFAGALNIGASNNPFGKKKSAYKESAILLTKELTKLSNFKFKEINKRSIDLADAAVSLWPGP